MSFSGVNSQSLPLLTSPHGGNIYAIARAKGLRPEQLLDFSASINPLGWPPAAASAYRRAGARIGHYPEPYAERLTTVLAEYHGLDPCTLLIGNGSTQLIYLLARVLVARRVLCVAPLFSEHAVAFQRQGVQVEYLTLRPPQFLLSCDTLGDWLVRGYDVLILTNPNSPTATLVSREQLVPLVRVCQRAGTKLLVDETFIDWVEEESLKYLAGQTPHLVVLRSLTKFFAVPGLRIGYAIACSQLIRQMKEHIEPWSVNTVAQDVAVACLADQGFPQRSRTFMERERTWFFQKLAAVPGLQPIPSRTNFILVKLITAQVQVSTIVHALADANILIRDCANFRGLGKRFFRVAVRTRAENRRLLAALRATVAG